MIVVNLEKYSDDGYKKSANSLNADAPDNITHVRFYYNNFIGNNYVQADFVTGKNSTVEYDETVTSYTKFKMFVSTDGTNYTENKSYGGTEGHNVANSGVILDPADFDDGQIIVKQTIGGIEQFVPSSFDTGVDYKYLRCRIYQSGTGAIDLFNLIDGSGSDLDMTIADEYDPAGSSRSTTGIYICQFTTGGADLFHPDIVANAGFSIFETKVITVFDTSTGTITGYCVVAPYYDGGEIPAAYSQGRIQIRTYNTSWVLADSILDVSNGEIGITIEFRIFA